MPTRASAVAALLAAAATVAAGSFPSVTATAASSTEDAQGVTLVQANIKSALSSSDFRADVATVLSASPDFVTYNEVPERLDAYLAPAGHEVFRNMRNRYTRANAVAWRTDRWTAVDSGTRRISNYREVPRGRKVMLGLRFANWVTLQSHDGRQVSVVAVHVPPRVNKELAELLRPTVRRIGRLVEDLAPRGPVLVGGDFNVHYTNKSLYPRDLFDAARMEPTYDTLGSHFPTGDHQGATIDYVFNRGGDLLEASDHRSMELKSDHDAVVADLDWTTDPAGTVERVVSNPRSDDARRDALDVVLRALRGLRAGEHASLVTSDVSLGAVQRRLRRAVRRDVHLTLVTRSDRLTRAERRVGRAIRRSDDPQSHFVHCRSDCLERWRDSGMATTFLLVADEAATPRLRIDANRPLSSRMIKRRTRLWRYTGAVALSKGEDLLAAVR